MATIDTLTVTGVVATTPRRVTRGDGLSISSFRLASNSRRYDAKQGKWIDGETNWFTVSAFRQLADGIGTSLSKGDRVVVTGRLRVREWNTEERSGTSVEIVADAVGPDLTWGTAVYTRRERVSRDDGSALTEASAPDAYDAHDAPVPFDEHISHDTSDDEARSAAGQYDDARAAHPAFAARAAAHNAGQGAAQDAGQGITQGVHAESRGLNDVTSATDGPPHTEWGSTSTSGWGRAQQAS